MKIVKTLKHLNSLFLNPEKGYFYADSFSLDIIAALESSYFLDISKVQFSDFLNLLTSIESKKTNPDVLDEFRVGGNLKFNRVEIVENLLDFSIRGDVITAWLPGYASPVRLEFFGEECEKISILDKLTGKRIKQVYGLYFLKDLPDRIDDINSLNIQYGQTKDPKFEKIIFSQNIDKSVLKFLNDVELIETDLAFPQLFFSNKNVLLKEIDRHLENGYRVALRSSNLEDLDSKYTKLINNLDKIKIHGEIIPEETLRSLPAGFESVENKILFLTEKEIFGTIYLNKSKDKEISSSRVKKLLRQFEGEIDIGDYVVHEDYGIGIYSGLKQETVDGVISDYLLIKFDKEDEIFVPLTQVNKITKYLGNEGSTPKLTSFGKGSWQRLKNSVKKSIYLSAKELIKHYAKRELSEAFAISKSNSDDYNKFVEDFGYSETTDQERAIEEVLEDLEQPKPMNRLLVGDVGFGKTEVILRAAFKIVENGGQVAVLAPTTVLVAQHEKVFRERFRSFNKYKVDSVSRFKSSNENRQIIDKANEGKIDILVGTHRLLSTDLKFKNLQLLVVDEEQKFGVKQKEKIKKLNYGVHVLNVSATPIPRTLSLALSSVQEISIITTPPKGRKPVDTEIIFESWEKVANAIQKEVSRGGQVYFVHNRVQSIQGISNKLKELLPQVSFEFAHGQMTADRLDKILADFYLQKFDVLISTSIIENGLDLPNVNTIAIHDSHKFGLSQLYQMRGRVGRSDRKAYCLLMAPKPGSKVLEDNIDALEDLVKHKEGLKKQKEKQKLYMERLTSLVQNQDLGSGFKIASKDLEIRGAGNILGAKQHGHISTVGYALYIEMLAQEIEKLKDNPEVSVNL